MTKSQRREHKVGNQVRKLALMLENRKGDVYHHITLPQNGRYTASARGFLSRLTGH